MTICKKDGNAPKLTFSGWITVDGSKHVFSSDPVPPHAPIVLDFDKDMAWATTWIQGAGSTENLTSRQLLDDPRRLTIIPNDGRGFEPGEPLSIQLLNRQPTIRAYPNPPSSVSIDGQAVPKSTISSSRVARIRIESIGNQDHFDNTRFNQTINTDFPIVVSSNQAFPLQGKSLKTTSLPTDSSLEPRFPGAEPYVTYTFIQGDGPPTIRLFPPRVRSGPGRLTVADNLNPEEFDTVWYDWQPPQKLIYPDDGFVTKCNVVEFTISSSSSVDCESSTSEKPFITAELAPPRCPPYCPPPAEELQCPDTTIKAQVPSGTHDVVLRRSDGIPLDARTITAGSGLIVLPVTAWKVAPGPGSEISDEVVASYFDVAEGGSKNSINRIWEPQAGIRFVLSAIRVLDLTNVENGAHTNLSYDVPVSSVFDLIDLSGQVAESGYDASSANVFFVGRIGGGEALGYTSGRFDDVTWGDRAVFMDSLFLGGQLPSLWVEGIDGMFNSLCITANYIAIFMKLFGSDPCEHPSATEFLIDSQERRGVLAHEIGHLLGLKHPEGDPCGNVSYDVCKLNDDRLMITGTSRRTCLASRCLPDKLYFHEVDNPKLATDEVDFVDEVLTARKAACSKDISEFQNCAKCPKLKKK